MTDTTNIWENLDLSEDHSETAYKLLIGQKENFAEKTSSELLMDIESYEITDITSDEDERRVQVYSLFVKVPSLGNFRKEILHVYEFFNVGRFPVNIRCDIDDSTKENVKEEDFLNVIKEILSKDSVKRVIENLFRQSIEAKKMATNKN